MTAKTWLLGAFAALGAAFGCAQILELGDYAVTTGEGGVGADGSASCDADLTKQCYACTPTTNAQLLNACTTSMCTGFDRSRLGGLLADGGLPAVPPGSPSDAGATTTDAGGLPDCTTVSMNPVVYVSGTAKPYVQAVATALYADTAPITVIYVGQSSCDAWNQLLTGVMVTGPASYWPGNSTETKCMLPMAGVVPDVIVSDVFATTCGSLVNGLPKDVGDFFGPVQTMIFIAPTASPEHAISAEAAYLVYGLGMSSGVAPWTDENFLFRLDPTSGTQAIIGTAIGVAPADWKGNNQHFSSKETGTMTAIGAADAPKSLGILSAVNYIDSLRGSLHELAYQHYGQSCGYYPDSSETSKDKKNVRDGHYTLWGPVHLGTKVDGSGFPVKDTAKRVVNILTGVSAPPPSLDIIQAEAQDNLVPTCAMHVSRTAEMGPLAPFKATSPCGCYFEFKATGATACSACKTSSDCPSDHPLCNFAYCEAQ